MTFRTQVTILATLGTVYKHRVKQVNQLAQVLTHKDKFGSFRTETPAIVLKYQSSFIIIIEVSIKCRRCINCRNPAGDGPDAPRRCPPGASAGFRRCSNRVQVGPPFRVPHRAKGCGSRKISGSSLISTASSAIFSIARLPSASRCACAGSIPSK